MNQSEDSRSTVVSSLEEFSSNHQILLASTPRGLEGRCEFEAQLKMNLSWSFAWSNRCTVIEIASGKWKRREGRMGRTRGWNRCERVELQQEASPNEERPSPKVKLHYRSRKIEDSSKARNCRKSREDYKESNSKTAQWEWYQFLCQNPERSMDSQKCHHSALPSYRNRLNQEERLLFDLPLSSHQLLIRLHSNSHVDSGFP